MSRDKILHDIATKVTTTQLSLELVVQKLEMGTDLDSEDLESIRAAYQGSCEAADLIRKAREQERELGKVQLPLLPADEKRTLLIVDDDEMIRKLLSQIFRNAGYHVFAACDGAEALALLEAQDIDVVLTDLRMPGADGARLAEAIRSMKKQPVLCIMSGDNRYLDVVQDRVHPDGVIQKPFSQKVLVDEVYRAQVIKSHTA